MPLTPTAAQLSRTCVAFTAEQRERLERAAAANGRTTMAVILRTLVDRHLNDLVPGA